MMDVNVEDKIRQRAYEIWVSAGMAARDPAADWLEAERAIMRETAMPVANRTVVKRSAVKRATNKAMAAESVAAIASGEAAAPKAAAKARAATASAAKPESVRKRAKTQA